MMTKKEEYNYCVEALDKIVGFIERNIMNESIIYGCKYNSNCGKTGNVYFKIGDKEYRLIMDCSMHIPFITSKTAELYVESGDKWSELMNVIINCLPFKDNRGMFKRFFNACEKYENRRVYERTQRSIESINLLLEGINNESIR